MVEYKEQNFAKEFKEKSLTFAAQSDKGPESYPEPEEDMD